MALTIQEVIDALMKVEDKTEEATLWLRFKQDGYWTHINTTIDVVDIDCGMILAEE